MAMTRAILSNGHELPGNDTEVGHVERPSGFQTAARSRVTDEPTTEVRARGGWAIVEQFVEHGFRYRLIRRPLERGNDVSRLTKREREVLALALEGHSNKSIAYALGVSPSTIGVLIFRAAAKLGVKSRSELLSAYARLLLTGDP